MKNVKSMLIAGVIFLAAITVVNKMPEEGAAGPARDRVVEQTTDREPPAEQHDDEPCPIDPDVEC